FTEDGIDALADSAEYVNSSIENIGARRLYTVIERVLEEISFMAPDMAGQSISIDRTFVERNLGPHLKQQDLGRYML
ncbi:MAG: HslU--HslV peptidase ATPase subunit, partial [Deltaproteobacteria bacterium]